MQEPENTRPSGPPRFGAALLIGLVAGAAGGFLAATLLRDSTARDADHAQEADALRVPIADLTAAVAALHAEIAKLRAAPQTPVTPAPLDPGTAPATGSELAALAAAIEQLAARAGAPGLEAPTPPVDPERRRVLAAWRNRTDDEPPREQWLLWTPQQVLDTYGLPDSAYHSDDRTTSWVYDVTADDNVTFQFADGRVIHAW